MFRSSFAETIFNQKYRHEGCYTWEELSRVVVEDICRDLMTKEDKDQLFEYIRDMKFIPGGRYLYYAGRKKKFINNCFMLRAEEDSREDWANLSRKAESCLMVGGGIGVDYSTYRQSGRVLHSTGGLASGPIPKMHMINEIGRNVIQGASRRSAIYASLNHQHGDVKKFIHAKDWHNMFIPGTNIPLSDVKVADFNFPAPLDMTNISVNYDTKWYMNYHETGDVGEVFMENVRQALKSGDPGFSFNFFDKEDETLRNAPVSGDTMVLTSDGYQRVIDIVDTTVTVWTGKQWASTMFKRTKENTDTVTVSFSGGRFITCDPEHEFLVEKYNVSRGRLVFYKIERIRADRLKEGQVLHVSPPAPSPEDVYPVKVISVKSGKKQDVFCCNVGVEEHSFMAEGVIISNCCELTSSDDSDVCNIGSLNFSRINSLSELDDVTELATKFLICGSIVGDVPYEKVRQVREKNRRLGLGVMGLHEWMIQRGLRYGMNHTLAEWLNCYKGVSDHAAYTFSKEKGVSAPVGKRAIAPTGTIGILAGTTTGIEPIYAIAYKRRYLKGNHWHYQNVVDSSAKYLIEHYNVDPEKLESSIDLAADYKRRIRFQAEVQAYIDHAISSTINLPAWGTELNNEDMVEDFAKTLARYSHRIRGFTCYPDGARGGQPITSIPYSEAVKSAGEEYREVYNDVCDITGKGGTCGS